MGEQLALSFSRAKRRFPEAIEYPDGSVMPAGNAYLNLILDAKSDAELDELEELAADLPWRAFALDWITGARRRLEAPHAAA